MKILLLAATVGYALAQPPDIQQIMARVAENQSKAQEQRKNYVYSQKQLLRMVRGSGKVAREEKREYAMAPKEHGFDRQLTHFEGKYEQHGDFIPYTEPGFEYKELDLDGNLIDEMSDEMTNDDNAKDGIGCDLFPLTSGEQQKYNFKFLKAEVAGGRQVYRVSFAPKPGKHEGTPWKGEALIDAEEFQPVMVHTRMAGKIPMAVKILLGTNIKGLGFSISYQKFADGVWFPVSYGGEFEVRAVFFYKRVISVSMKNTDFRRTDVNSNVAYVPNEDK